MNRDRAGKPLRSIEMREELYNEVLELRKQNLSYNRIIAVIQAKHGIRLSKGHVSNWLTRTHLPMGCVRPFDPTPSPELAYLIRVKMGDASQSLNKSYAHKINLRVTDKDFAEEFARCLGIVLRRTAPPVRWACRYWRTEASSVLLRHFLMKPLESLRPIIKHSKQCLIAFLRGFFDSEASMSGRDLTVSNNNLPLLIFVGESLNSLGIQTTGPHLLSEAGRIVLIKGKFYRQNKDMHYLYVRTKSLNRFQEIVGFSLERKARPLRFAVRDGN